MEKILRKMESSISLAASVISMCLIGNYQHISLICIISLVPVGQGNLRLYNVMQTLKDELGRTLQAERAER